MNNWLDGQGPDRPFFLWVHLYDPHVPTIPPRHGPTGSPSPTTARSPSWMRRSDDSWQAPRQRPESGASWILVGDHGEALDGEHGSVRMEPVYDPTMRIPFILRGPRPMAGRVEASQTVSNVDVMPTALGMLGMEPLPDLDGRDLSKALVGPAAKRDPVYMESEAPLRRFGFHPELAAAEGPYKLLATPSPRLFDVDADPRETRDLQFDHPTVVLRLQRSVDDIQGRRIEASSLAAGPELTARLAALGYVAGSADTPRAFADLPDAKEQQAFITRVEAARASADPKAAIDAWKAILSDQPDLGEARLALAALLLRAGATADAERMLREGVAQRPDPP